MTETNKTYEGSIEFEARLASDDEAVGSMPVRGGVLNPFGSVHAGAMIWFADVVATTLALQGIEPTPGMKGFPLAINLNANILSNTRDGTIRATATFVKKGRRVSTVRTLLRSDEGATLLDMTTTHIAA